MTIRASTLRIGMVTAEEAESHMPPTDHRRGWLHLVLTTAIILLQRFWIPSLLQRRECLLHRHSTMVTGMGMDIGARLVQAQVLGAMAIAMGTHLQETKAMDMGPEEGPKVNITAISMVRVAEETSIMMAILVVEGEVQIHIRMVVAPSATATTKVKITVMVSEVEVRTTTTKGMAGDEYVVS